MLRGSVINKFSQLSPGSFIHSVGISNETSFSYPQTIHAEAEEGHRRAFARSTATLRYEPCTQFINVSQRALHIYWRFSAMSHAIHKIVSKKCCQSYFSSRRSPHHGKNKNRDLWASSQSRFLFCLCAAHCSRNFQFSYRILHWSYWRFP